MILTEAHQYTGKAEKIVSLVPSITELLYYFNLNDQVIGITKFCIHPTEWFRNKIRVGGTKNIDIQKIEYLNPDLIIANKEENVKDQVGLLENKFEILLTDVHTLDESVAMIKTIGLICKKTNEGERLAASILHEFSSLPQKENALRTAYLIWKDPLMTIGRDSFINDMLNKAGFENVFADLTRYPEVSIEELKSRNPDLVLLSSEPYPFTQKHIDWLQQQIPYTKILLADGEMFSWYGSRLLQAPAYFRSLHKQLNI